MFRVFNLFCISARTSNERISQIHVTYALTLLTATTTGWTARALIVRLPLPSVMRAVPVQGE